MQNQSELELPPGVESYQNDEGETYYVHVESRTAAWSLDDLVGKQTVAATGKKKRNRQFLKVGKLFKMRMATHIIIMSSPPRPYGLLMKPTNISVRKEEEVLFQHHQ